MALKYRGNNADDSALDSLMRVSGGVRVSAHVPTQNQQRTYSRRLLQEVKATDMRLLPFWEGIQLIPDEITKASKGEIVITAVMLMNFKVIREDGFTRFGFKIG